MTKKRDSNARLILVYKIINTGYGVPLMSRKG